MKVLRKDINIKIKNKKIYRVCLYIYREAISFYVENIKYLNTFKINKINIF